VDGIGGPLVIAGVIVAFIGAIRLLIHAFTTSVLWGLVAILIHPLILLYVALNWHDAKGPFINYLLGLGLIGLGSFFGGT
jgi:hypothetical protein